MVNQHHQRKRNRLSEWDYSTPHWYFVTICTQNHRELLGEIVKGKMILNEYGEIVQKQWLWLKEHFEYIELDEFIVMPNHIHGILVITENNVGAGRDLPDQDKRKRIRTGHDLSNNNEQRKKRTSPDLSLHKPTKIKTLSELIGAFKTTSSKLIHRNGLSNFSWQRSFYDQIIRNENSLGNIKLYIRENPQSWETDKNNPENIKC